MVFVVAIGLSSLAPPGYWHQMQTLTSVEEDYNWDSNQGRRQLAIRGMQYMARYPLFGVGIGNFGRAEGTISTIADEPGTQWSAPHNSYVEMGAELGVPGFVLFIGLIVGCIVAPWRLRRRVPAGWERGTGEEQFLFHSVVFLPLAAIGFAVPAFFVSFAYSDPIYMLAAITGAFCACVEVRLRALAPPSVLADRYGQRRGRQIGIASAQRRGIALGPTRPGPPSGGASPESS
jgi:hypothetical protein